jgi:hypothetical protein
MASSVNLGAPLWQDGMQWTSLLQRQFDGGAAVWDSNLSATAVNPLGGVFPGPGTPLAVTAQGSPNMSVLVNAGYVAVPHPTQGHGVYLFGLQAQATLTVAANSSGSSRTDIVIARVYDEGNNTSYCDVEIAAGTPGDGQPATPSAAIILAAVTVASGATGITSGNITDKRTYSVAPGGALPTTAAAAPALGPGQVIWNSSTGLLETLAPAVVYVELFTTSTTFTGPDGVDEVYVENWGGGGGGGGGFQDWQNGAGGISQGGAAGGGGEYAADTVTIVPTHTYEITIGAGGARGNSGTNYGSGAAGTAGSAGTATTFTGGSVTVTANGGQGGQPGGVNYPDSPGEGGTGSADSAEFPGGTGGAGGSGRHGGAGGGGGASGAPGAAGGSGQDGDNYGDPGSGGIPGPAGGPGGDGGGYSQLGAKGTTPGGGGGGGWGDPDTYWQPGGAGAPGQMLISWVIQPAQLVPIFTTDSDVDDLDVINTSTGGTGLDTGGTSLYGWGIGGGTDDGSFSADGFLAQEIQVTFDADGATDFQIDAKWQLAVPEAAVDSASPSIPHGECRIIVQLDGTTLDTVYLCCAASGGVTYPGDGGAFTVYTSAQRGTTPGSGSHTVTLAIQTENTLSGKLSGVHIGDVASVGTSPYPFAGGALPSPYTAGLVAENCSLRVAGIIAATL